MSVGELAGFAQRVSRPAGFTFKYLCSGTICYMYYIAYLHRYYLPIPNL